MAPPASTDGPPKPPRPLRISVGSVPSADPADPVLLIRYCLAPRQPPAWVFLPKGENEIARFRELSVRVDGLEPDPVVDLHPNASPKRSFRVELQPGESVTLRVRLRTIYRFPADWQDIEVRVRGTGGHKAEVVGHLTLHRAEVTPSPQTVRNRQLIRQLGSPRYAERQAAANALDALGDDALHHLRQAAAASEDPEILRRAGQLVQGILARRLARRRGS